jgi:hypothetical protein
VVRSSAKSVSRELREGVLQKWAAHGGNFGCGGSEFRAVGTNRMKVSHIDTNRDGSRIGCSFFGPKRRFRLIWREPIGKEL